MKKYNKFEKALIKESVKKLNEKERRAVLLHFYQNLSVAETSKSMRMSWGDTNQLLEGAIKELKRIFLKYEAQILTRKLIHEFSGVEEMKKIIKKTLFGNGKRIDYEYLNQRKEDDFRRAYGI